MSFVLKEEKVENRANTYMITREATYETIFRSKTLADAAIQNLRPLSGHTGIMSYTVVIQ